MTKQKSLATFSHAQARIQTLAVVAERQQAVSDNHIRLSAQCTHIVLPSVTKVCDVISAALGPLTDILFENIVFWLQAGYISGSPNAANTTRKVARAAGDESTLYSIKTSLSF